jgi:AraC-like DNA-binding protein
MIMSVAYKIFRPSSLGDIVEVIGDLDIADAEMAKALTFRHAPSTSIHLIAQYRSPAHANWQFGPDCRSLHEPILLAMQNRAGIVNVRPTGPLGIIIVGLRPEAAARILGGALGKFGNTKIDLKDVFNVRDVELLEERLAEAKDSAERVAHVESFLMRCVRDAEPELAAYRAARYLRHSPAIPVQQVAWKLDISERRLHRSFRTTFGIGPKQFARIVRVQKVLAARRNGFDWADIAYACGYADQAHMIKDFGGIVGQSPRAFDRPGTPGELNTIAGCVALTYTVSRPPAEARNASATASDTTIAANLMLSPRSAPAATGVLRESFRQMRGRTPPQFSP